MQKKVLYEKLREQSVKLSGQLHVLTDPEKLTAKEIENILSETEDLSRILAACKFLKEHTEVSNELNVHLKIMENFNKQEEVKSSIEVPTDEKKDSNIAAAPVETTTKSDKVGEEIAVSNSTDVEGEEESKLVNLKRIEFSLNDRFRIIKELFHQSESEFATAFNQLNMTENIEDAEEYLNSLKSLYSWKAEHPLVKLIYSLTQKRFQ